MAVASKPRRDDRCDEHCQPSLQLAQDLFHALCCGGTGSPAAAPLGGESSFSGHGGTIKKSALLALFRAFGDCANGSSSLIVEEADAEEEAFDSDDDEEMGLEAFLEAMHEAQRIIGGCAFHRGLEAQLHLAQRQQRGRPGTAMSAGKPGGASLPALPLLKMGVNSAPKKGNVPGGYHRRPSLMCDDSHDAELAASCGSPRPRGGSPAVQERVANHEAPPSASPPHPPQPGPGQHPSRAVGAQHHQHPDLHVVVDKAAATGSAYSAEAAGCFEHLAERVEGSTGALEHHGGLLTSRSKSGCLEPGRESGAPVSAPPKGGGWHLAQHQGAGEIAGLLIVPPCGPGPVSRSPRAQLLAASAGTAPAKDGTGADGTACQRLSLELKHALFPPVGAASEASALTGVSSAAATPAASARGPPEPSPLAVWQQPEETLIIFDWDDTLCPTTFIMDDPRLNWKEVAPCFADEPEMPLEFDSYPGSEGPGALMVDALRRHVAAAAAALRRARAHGAVVLVTLAKPGWVEVSMRNFLPGLEEVLEELDIEVVYARSALQKWAIRCALADGLDVLKLMKQVAISRCITKFYRDRPSRAWKNVLCIGDSTTEHEALMEAVFAYVPPQEAEPCRSKMVKLVDAPDVPELTAELVALSGWIGRLASFDGDVYIESNTPAELEDPLSELEGMQGGAARRAQ